MSIFLRLAAPLAALVLSLGAAGAQQPAPLPAQNAAPTPAPSHLAAARDVAVSSGIVRSIDVIPPQLYERIREQLVPRPELTKDLNEVMAALQPEMELQKQKIVNDIALIYAQALTEAELTVVLDEMVREMQSWSQDLAEYVMVRIRAEMQKRGFQLQ